MVKGIVEYMVCDVRSSGLQGGLIQASSQGQVCSVAQAEDGSNFLKCVLLAEIRSSQKSKHKHIMSHEP